MPDVYEGLTLAIQVLIVCFAIAATLKLESYHAMLRMHLRRHEQEEETTSMIEEGKETLSKCPFCHDTGKDL